MKVSIRTKLTLATIICIVLVSFGIGVISYKLMKRYLYKQISSRLVETAEYISKGTSYFLGSHGKGIETLSNNKTIRSFLSGSGTVDIAQVQDMFLILADNYNDLILLNESGTEIIKIVNGKNSVKTNKIPRLAIKKRAIANNGLGFKLFANKNTHILTGIDIYSKVLSTSHEKFIGVVVGTIDYNNFYDMLHNAYVDSDFRVKITDNKTNTVLCGYSGNWVNDRLQHSSIMKDMDWTVTVAFARANFVEHMNTLKLYIFLVMIVFIIIGIVLSMLISRQLSNPLLAIIEATKRISDGNLSELIDIKSNDEVGVLALSFNKMTEKLEKSQLEMETVHQHSLHMLTLASEYKDPERHDHIKRVAKLTTELAIELGVKHEFAVKMGVDSILHEIGRLCLSDSILFKPGNLTDMEFETIKRQTIIGARILGKNKQFSQVRKIVMSYHERWDGSGYPEGLKGNTIPLAARIVAVADVFDILTFKRPYRRPKDQNEAVDIIRQGSGIQFDPKVVDAFLYLYEKGELKKYLRNPDEPIKTKTNFRKSDVQ